MLCRGPAVGAFRQGLVEMGHWARHMLCGCGKGKETGEGRGGLAQQGLAVPALYQQRWLTTWPLPYIHTNTRVVAAARGGKYAHAILPRCVTIGYTP
jgi:hypothetical protein